MRINEFELTEDELFELKMSPTNLQKMAAGIDARAGMEFEMIIPGANQGDDDDYDLEPDYEMDESFPTGRGWRRDVLDFFMGGEFGSSRREVERTLEQMDEAYFEWKDGRFDDWFRDNSDELYNRVRNELSQEADESDEDFELRIHDDIANSGEGYLVAIEDMREEFDGEDQFEEFLSDEGIFLYSEFADTYNLTWPYVRYPERSGGLVSVEDVAGEFEQAIGRDVNYSTNYHGGRREPDKYVVEPDGSLEPDEEGDGGLEFVSPPLPLPEMLSDLDKVVKWAGQVGAYTNSSTGLHMNVSVPNFDLDKLDYVKLAIFLGDEYVLKEFGRQGNTYCKSAMQQIATDAKKNPDKVKTMLQQMQGNLSSMASKIVHTGSTHKYTSINTKTGYIEFRSPGGDWLGEYAADQGKLKNTLLRFVVALDIAMKPEMFRQEYMKKLYKTLDQGDKSDTIQFFARFAAGELPMSALKSFVKQAQVQRKFAKEKPGADEPHTYTVYNINDTTPLTRFRDVTRAEAVEQFNRYWGSAQELRDQSYMLDQDTGETINGNGEEITNPVRARMGEPEPSGDLPGSTNDIQRQRRAAAMPPIDFNGNYEVYRVESGRTVYRFQVENTQEAYAMLQRWRESMMQPGLNPRDFNVRAVAADQADPRPSAPATPSEQLYKVQWVDDHGNSHDANVRAPNANAAMERIRSGLAERGLTARSIEADVAQQDRGSDSLPPGNARWRVLDRNGTEIYSFINTTAQSDANAYASRWLRDNANSIAAHGPFDVVPVPR